MKENVNEGEGELSQSADVKVIQPALGIDDTKTANCTLTHCTRIG